MTPTSSPNRREPGLRKGVLFTGAGSVISLIALMLETIIAVRFLATDVFGIYVILTASINFLVVVVDFGFQNSITQLIAGSEDDRQSNLISSAIIFRTAVIALASVLMLVLGQSLMVLFDETGASLQYAWYIPLMLAASSFDELFFSMLRGFHSYRQIAIAQIMRSALRITITTVLLAVFAMGIEALILSWIISFGISALYQCTVMPVDRRLAWSLPVLKELIVFGVPLHVSRFLSFAVRRLDIFLLGALAGPTAVAFYGVANRIPESFQRLSESFTSVYFPKMSSLLASGQHSQAQLTLNRSLRLLSFALACVAVGCTIFSHDITVLLFSERYAAASVAFAILMIAFQMQMVVRLMGYTLVSVGKPRVSMVESLVRTTIHVLCNVLLIPVFSFAGAAAALLWSNHLGHPFAVWLMQRSRLRVDALPYVKQTLLMLITVALFVWLQPENLLIKALLVVVFVVMNLLLSTVSLQDLKLVLPRRITSRFGGLVGLKP